MRALLDVNVLIALLDELHVHHAAATRWVADHRRTGWASCPLTENGCIRIMSSVAYSSPQAPGAVAESIAAGSREGNHAFWPDAVSLIHEGAIRWDKVLSPRQITDCYLLALAVANSGCLVTLDRTIPLAAVPRSRQSQLVVIGGGP